jgi:hypothetical protein
MMSVQARLSGFSIVSVESFLDGGTVENVNQSPSMIFAQRFSECRQTDLLFRS